MFFFSGGKTMEEKKDSNNKNNKQVNIDPVEIFNKKPLAKMGLIITILSIVGLIISFSVPWVYLDFDNSGLDDDEKFFGHDLENEDDIHLAEIVSTGGFYSQDVTDYTDFIDGTPSMADFGFILMLLVGLFFIVVSIVEDNTKKSLSKLINFFKYSVGLASIVPALMVFLAGVRFVGININTAENAEVLEDYMLKDLNLFFPAAYVILIFGLIFFFMIFLIVKPDLKSVLKLKNINQKSGNVVLNTQRFALVFVLLCIAGLVFMPLFPWMASPSNGDSVYLHEDDVMMNGEMAEELEDQLEDYNSYYRRNSRYYDDYGLDEYYDYSPDNQMDKAEDYIDGMIGLKDNLSGIGWFFWISLIFSILVLIGVEIYNLGEKYHFLANIMFLLGVVVLIASILILLNHVFFFGNIGEISEAYEDLQGGGEITFGFNYFPLLTSVGLLLTSLMYTIKIFPVFFNRFLCSISKGSSDEE